MPDSAGLEALFVRLYFDRHIMARLALDLRGHGYDVLTTEEAGKDTVTDEEQLAFITCSPLPAPRRIQPDAMTCLPAAEGARPCEPQG
jgi:hypothetical protein